MAARKCRGHACAAGEQSERRGHLGRGRQAGFRYGSPLPPQHNKGCGSARHVKRSCSALTQGTSVGVDSAEGDDADAREPPESECRHRWSPERGWARRLRDWAYTQATNDTNQRTRFDELSLMTTRAPRCAPAGRRPRAEQYGHARRKVYGRRHPVAI
ncbi:hypothetical protein MRX96_030885 [Rhipicephalus microplus]